MHTLHKKSYRQKHNHKVIEHNRPGFEGRWTTRPLRVWTTPGFAGYGDFGISLADFGFGDSLMLGESGTESAMSISADATGSL